MDEQTTSGHIQQSCRRWKGARVGERGEGERREREIERRGEEGERDAHAILLGELALVNTSEDWGPTERQKRKRRKEEEGEFQYKKSDVTRLHS